jgi:hypothetical protein
LTQRWEKGVRNYLAARVARRSWRKIPEWLTNYNWTEGQAGLTEGQASTGAIQIEWYEVEDLKESEPLREI